MSVDEIADRLYALRAQTERDLEKAQAAVEKARRELDRLQSS